MTAQKRDMFIIRPRIHSQVEWELLDLINYCRIIVESVQLSDQADYTIRPIGNLDGNIVF